MIEDLKKEKEDQNKKIDLQQQQINTLLSNVELLKQKINTPVK